MKVYKKAGLLVIASILLLSACSTTQLAYQQNIELYFSSKIGVALSNEAVKDSAVDLIYVKNGERPIATMALAYIENGQYKWLSNDNAMIVTNHGRLVRTLGFSENLLYVSQAIEDPVKFGANMTPSKNEWSRRIDTDIGDSGAKLSSQWQVIENTSLTVNDLEFSTVKVLEEVTYISALYGVHNWVNTFWFDSNTNQLLKSSQTIAPNIDSLEIIYISRALRLLANTTSGEQP